EGQRPGRGRGDHGRLRSPDREPGGAQDQARDPPAADRRLRESGAHMKIRRLSTRDAGFDAALGELTRYDAVQDRGIGRAVRAIGWTFSDASGTLRGQRVTPLERVGLYVPGGKAAYPSSVLMNAIPAKVAGVPEVVMVSPNPTPLVLAAAALAGVDRVFALGG